MIVRYGWVAGLSLLVVGCSGGGSDAALPADDSSVSQDPPSQPAPDIVGLELPDQFSVIAAADEGGNSGSAKTAHLMAHTKGLAGTLSALKTFSDADTDYSTDESNVYVYDRSMESLGIINEIVCYINQTGAAERVNGGAYVALVDESRCRQGQAGAEEQMGESSGGKTTELARWVVESTRTDNDSPQLVRIWVPEPEGEGNLEGEHAILVELTIERGVSESEPFGKFRLNFRGVLDGASVGMPGIEVETMMGTLATVDNDGAGPQFTFISVGGSALPSTPPADFGYTNAASVRLDDANGTSGLARTSSHETWSYGGQSGSRRENFALAYDGSRFLSHRDADGDELTDEAVCRSRDDFDVNVWRYNLYHEHDGEFRGRAVAAGQRVELNSGFPFSYDDGDANVYGWLGYHGAWTETGATPPDGQTIERFDYDSDSTMAYTLRVAPGRLTRRVAHEESLGAFAGDSFQYWGPHPTLGTHGQWLVAVGNDLSFSIVSAMSWGEQGVTFADEVDHDGNQATPSVAAAAPIPLVHNETLWMWSEALGGSVVYVHDDSVAAAARKITFFSEDFVTAADAELFPSGVDTVTLYCYDRCLKGGLTQADVDAAAGPSDLFHEYRGNALAYTLSVANGRVLLTDNTNGAPVDATALSLDAVHHRWGIGTGEMLLERLADESRPWTVNEQPMTFRWETGPNAWNRTVTATDVTGATVLFDRPLQILYVHSLANDANASAESAGKRFLLEYGGAGNLHGFPSRQDGDRWYATVALEDGVVLDGEGATFVVKGLEKEQSMREIGLAQCAGLDADTAYDDPSLAPPAVASIGTVSITLAGRPQLDAAAPAVIAGEIQD